MELKKYDKEKSRRKSSIDLSTMVYGKVPPQAKEIEEAILGSCLDDHGSFLMASELLKPECFYVDAHQRIFKAMINLSAINSPVDLLTVVQQLKKQEELEIIGGPYYLTKINSSVVSRISEKHCLIVLEKYMAREMIRISGDAISAAYEDETDIFELMDQHERDFTAVVSQTVQTKITNIDEAIVENLTVINDLRTRGSSMTGVPSRFRDLDAITHGFQPGNLIILAARPSVGKTAFALNLARNAAKNNAGTVVIFSLEMSRKQLVNRMLSSESEIHLEKVQNGMLSDQEFEYLQSSVAGLAKDSILIDDSAAINIFQLRSKLRSVKRKKNLIMVIIDYLQLMSGTGDNRQIREQVISTISRELKVLAKELSVPIIALSQLSREPEKRKGDDKMPQLADLRESGAIEQDADDVLFLYRPEYYGNSGNEWGESTKGETHIKIAKHRNGRVGDVVKLTAKLSIQKFYDQENTMPADVKAQLPSGSFRPVKDLTGNLFETDF